MTRKIKGKSAKRKGSRAERQVRDMLRKIYPQELRFQVQRVPMSGAGWMKGDVYDANDTDSCYEVKCQEKLAVPEWWRQTVSQAGTSRTPVLVITQSYRPFYFILRESDWMEMYSHSVYGKLSFGIELFKNCANIFDRMSNESSMWGKVQIDGEYLLIIPSDDYINIKTDLFSQVLDKTVFVD